MRFNQRLFIQIDWDASLPEQFVTNHAIRSLEICSEITEPGKVLILKIFRFTKTHLNNSKVIQQFYLQ